MHAILKLDIAGLPVNWIGWEQAAELYLSERVLWDLGTPTRFHGGTGRNGRRSFLDIAPIVSVAGRHRGNGGLTLALNNETLFRRDRQVCLYCGTRFKPALLTRDHVVPRCQDGADVWENVVTACKSCNEEKGGRTPKQAGMELLAVPYAPNQAEMLILRNRRILADQNDYLARMIPDRPDRGGLFAAH